MGEKRRWGFWDQAKRDDSERWPSKSPRRWGEQNHTGLGGMKKVQANRHQMDGVIHDAFGNFCSTVPSWERTFCALVCRVPWRKICDANRVKYIYKNVAEWDDSAGREAFDNAKARYWAKINRLHCGIPLPDPCMYIDKVNFDFFIDPELVADLESCTIDPDADNKAVVDHFDSSEHEPVEPPPVTECCEANQSSSNWDKYIEKPAPVSAWDAVGNKNDDWQYDPWESRRNASPKHPVNWKDQNDDSWQQQKRWKSCQDRENSSWKHVNPRYYFPAHDDRNNHAIEKKTQFQTTWQRGQFLGPRNHQRTDYSGAPFRRENAVSYHIH